MLNKDDVIRMWKESGDLEIIGMPYAKIEAFAKLVAEHEREACAKIADEWAVGWPHPSTVIAEKIRGRA